jgi:hypothetical protein
MVCEYGANHSNLAKSGSNQDNVKPLGMKAKSNQKILAKTGIRNLPLPGTAPARRTSTPTAQWLKWSPKHTFDIISPHGRGQADP